jgi:hypothetical protein
MENDVEWRSSSYQVFLSMEASGNKTVIWNGKEIGTATQKPISEKGSEDEKRIESTKSSQGRIKGRKGLECGTGGRSGRPPRHGRSMLRGAREISSCPYRDRCRTEA